MRESRAPRGSGSTRCRGQVEQQTLEHEALVRVVLDQRLAGLTARVERTATVAGVELEQRPVDVERRDGDARERVAVHGLERSDALDECLGARMAMDALVVLTQAAQLRGPCAVGVSRRLQCRFEISGLLRVRNLEV